MTPKSKKLKPPAHREPGQEKLGALADAAKGAADRSVAAIDDALAVVDASNKRIARMEAEAQKKGPNDAWHRAV